MARLAVPATAALLAVNPAPARWAHPTAFPFLLPGANGRGQLALHWVLRQAGHVQRAVGEEDSGRRHDEQPRVEGEAATAHAVREVCVTPHRVGHRRPFHVDRPHLAQAHSHSPRQQHVLHARPLEQRSCLGKVQQAVLSLQHLLQGSVQLARHQGRGGRLLRLLLGGLGLGRVALGLAVVFQSIGSLGARSGVLRKGARPLQALAEGLADDAAPVAAFDNGAVLPRTALVLVLVRVLVLGLGCPAALRLSARHGPAPGCERGRGGRGWGGDGGWRGRSQAALAIRSVPR